MCNKTLYLCACYHSKAAIIFFCHPYSIHAFREECRKILVLLFLLSVAAVVDFNIFSFDLNILI